MDPIPRKVLRDPGGGAHTIDTELCNFIAVRNPRSSLKEMDFARNPSADYANFFLFFASYCRHKEPGAFR
jgi:hypothetical protein